jgi:hypothetical protein
MASTKEIGSTSFETKIIDFPEHKATLLSAGSNTAAADLAGGLNLPDFPSLLVLMGSAGSLDEALLPQLTRLYNLGIIPAVTESKAVVIDGGTDSGVMRLMGQSFSSQNCGVALIGVAPGALVSYPGMQASANPDLMALEPNHTHFILTGGTQWGDETATFFNLVATLLERNKITPQPVKWPKKAMPESGKVKGIGLLIGGESVSRKEVLRAVRIGLGVIIVAGSGGLADQISAALADRAQVPADAELAEIIANGNLFVHQLSEHDKCLQRLIIRELEVDNVLMKAWELFADYDENAKRHQWRYTRVQFTLILLGIISATMAVYWNFKKYQDEPKDNLPAEAQFLHAALLLLPILTTLFLTITNKFKPGIRWWLLRAGAESLKAEIYAYRTRAAAYTVNAEHVLFEQIRMITQRTMRTEVNHSALIPYDKTKGFPPYMFGASDQDGGFSTLNPEQYIRFRLDDQLSYYRKTTRRLDRKIRILYYLSFTVAGGATLLTVTNNQVWIAVTSAVIAGIGTYLGYSQLESSIVKYNQGCTDLENIKTWWMALSAQDQAKQENFDSLVKHTEQTVKAEIDGWVQQMQNSLIDLNKAQEKQHVQRNDDHQPAGSDAAPKPQPKPRAIVKKA